MDDEITRRPPMWPGFDSQTRRHMWDDEFVQKPIRVETCNGPLCAGKQASEYSSC